MSFHVPVMVSQVAQGLVTDPGGVYLDATAGGGGHSRAILQRLGPRGRLLAVDCDAEAVREVRRVLADYGGRVKVVRGRFGELKTLLRAQGIERLCGAFFDLGVSSHQIDTAARGFSYQKEGPLDMRMDPEVGAPAAQCLAALSAAALERLIGEYGQERRARSIARSICRRRQRRPLETTADLRAAVEATHPRHRAKTLARVFQALRIAVNDELGQLDRGLDAVLEALAGGGRLGVIAYHSLEDRLVKAKLAALVRGCICPPRVPVCICGRKPSFVRVERKARRAGAGEVEHNRRARSALLRLYEKL